MALRLGPACVWVFWHGWYVLTRVGMPIHFWRPFRSCCRINFLFLVLCDDVGDHHYNPFRLFVCQDVTGGRDPSAEPSLNAFLFFWGHRLYKGWSYICFRFLIFSLCHSLPFLLILCLVVALSTFFLLPSFVCLYTSCKSSAPSFTIPV